jgi:hydrogenase expression/formation protein HypE
MNQLIEQAFLPSFHNPLLEQRHDGAVFEVDQGRMAFSTDSYVVHPLEFPGGNIGELAVNGTVNDLAMCGARPRYLSAGFVIEEGLPMETLWRIVHAMGRQAQAAGVHIVTGDTKVVDKGKGDGVFINTAGIGDVLPGVQLNPRAVQPGDAVIVSGDIGRHGIAIMAVREGLTFETEVESDCAALADLALAGLEAGLAVRCMRDLTRGGLTSALVEISETAKVHISIDERAVPVALQVRGACEILGLDPFYVANEGRFVAFVAEADAPRYLDLLRRDPLGKDAALIGRVEAQGEGLVTLKSAIGAARILDMLSGEQLPRIC